MKKLVLIKIGGGFLTDKTKPFTIREDSMQAAADGIKRAMMMFPKYSFLVANGAGSFGHYVASETNSKTPSERLSAIHQSVVELNSVFSTYLRNAGVPAFTITPSSIITAHKSKVGDIKTDSILNTLTSKFVPLLFGDVVPDDTEKGLILSTETQIELLHERLSKHFDGTHVLYVGDTDGVLDEHGTTIPLISSTSWLDLRHIIKAPPGYDVTGGMLHKIESALKVAKDSASVHIIAGKDPETITAALSGGRVGTKIVA